MGSRTRRGVRPGSAPAPGAPAGAGHDVIASQPKASGRRYPALITPWLATSAGIVVLAAMAMSAPAAQLTFPPSAGPGTHCHGAGCALPDARHHARGGKAAPLARPGVRLSQRPRPPAAGQRDQRPAGSHAAPLAGVRVRYKMLAHWADRHFDAQIEITGQRELGHWNLAVTIPGTRIQLVIGAKWRRNARGDGGVAYGIQWPWANSSPNTARIVIFGTGTPRWPSSCVFSGHSCVFRRSG